MFKWLRSKWRKARRLLTHRTKPIEVTVGSSAVEDEINRRNEGKHRLYKRVALIQAHTDSKSGCSSYPVKMPLDFFDSPQKIEKRREYDISGYVLGWAKKFIDLVSMSMAVKLFKRDGVGIKGVGRQLEKWKPDVVISGHKNSVGHDSDVEGLEILMQEKYKGTFAEEEALRMIRLLNFHIGDSPLRGYKGIRWTTRKKRGDYNLDVYDDCGCKVVMLLEEAFIAKATPTARQIMEGEGLKNNAQAIANFCLGFDIINNELVSVIDG